MAVLNHNRVMAYLVPAEVYESMLERWTISILPSSSKRTEEKGSRSISMPYSLEFLRLPERNGTS